MLEIDEQELIIILANKNRRIKKIVEKFVKNVSIANKRQNMFDWRKSDCCWSKENEKRGNEER